MGEAVPIILGRRDRSVGYVPKTTLSITLEEMERNQTRLILEKDVSERQVRKAGAYQSWLSMLDNLEIKLK